MNANQVSLTPRMAWKAPDVSRGAMIGHNPRLEAVMRQVNLVAPSRCAVLIQGETGTGKELVARALHDQSGYFNGPFVKVNCAAIPAGLLESELFGHERGAFTGAVAQKMGRFQLAHQGTLFLDEIGELPVELQPKLLRALQDGEFERLGGTRTTRADVRIVAATNQDLELMVQQRNFRADLFYRLNVFPIRLPPLRERADDIPHLVRHFTTIFAARMGKAIDDVPDHMMQVLSSYRWPGNIRELQNFIERAVLMTEGRTLRLPLIELTQKVPTQSGDRRTLAEVERGHIVDTLEQTNWVVGGRHGAAERLGLPRTTLMYRMQKLGVSRETQLSRNSMAAVMFAQRAAEA